MSLSVEDRAKNFQENLSKGGDVYLKEGEIIGDFVIKKPTNLKPHYGIATLVGSLEVKHSDVTIENIIISAGKKSPDCLLIRKKPAPVFKNVVIKGNTKGLENEDGDWHYPRKLEIKLPVDKKVAKKIRISIPVDCSAWLSDITDIEISPKLLKAGTNELTLTFKDSGKGMLFQTDLVLESKSTKLQRKIPITATSFDSDVSDTEEFIWSFKPIEPRPDFSKLNRLYFGRQSENYSLEIDLDNLGLNGFFAEAYSLPQGLSYIQKNKKIIIRGKCNQIGEFPAKLIFKKENYVYEYEIKFIFEQKPKVEILTERFHLITKENERIAKKITVLQSNSNNLYFKEQTPLPEGLYLNCFSGELYGEIKKHGQYSFPVLITDEVSQKEIILDLLVMPTDELMLDESCRVINCIIGDKFEKKLIAVDQDSLAVKFSVNSGDIPIEIKTINGTQFLSGNPSKTGTYKVVIGMKDRYARVAEHTIWIKVGEKQLVKLIWNTNTNIECKGKKRLRYEEKISAKIVEKPDAQLRYKLVTNPEPEIIALSDDGSLSVVIQEGAEYRIEVETEFEGRTFRKEFVIQTILLSQSIKISGKDLGKAFIEKSQTYQQDKIVDSLPSGVVGEKYQAYILNNSDKNTGLILKVENLPMGLFYNSDNYEIKGVPEKNGRTSIQIKNEFGANLRELHIEIKKRSIFNTPSANENASSEDINQSQKNSFKLGKAFDI